MKSGRWPFVRALSQFLLWAAFIVIIVAGRDTTDNTFFSYLPGISPFLGISVFLTAHSFPSVFYPAAVFLIASLIFGRFFCGWICPLGATIDAADKQTVSRELTTRLAAKKISLKSWKYIVLITVLVLSLFGVQVAGVIDPVSLSIRTYGTAVFSYLDTLLKIIFNALYYVPFLNVISEFIYSILKDYLLDYNETQYYHHLPVFLLFAGILLSSMFFRRFWCKSLCPLGAIYSLTGRISFFRRHVDAGKCTNCLACERSCRMDAIYAKGVSTFEGECIKCFDCLKACKFDAVSFRFALPFTRRRIEKKNIEYDNIRFSRKQLLASIAGAAIAAPLFRRKPAFAADHSFLIRPPGALAEQDFVNKCVRCGQCMKVCPTNALHPLLFEYGADAVFTPHLVPRLGYCELKCNQCSAVCPSGALVTVPVSEKEKTVIGTAYIVRDLCIPWSEYSNCLVCEEMCPTTKKAIVFREEKLVNKKGEAVRVKLPYVLEDICIGCGICENKCPVQGSAAIRVRTPKKVKEGGGY